MKIVNRLTLASFFDFLFSTVSIWVVYTFFLQPKFSLPVLDYWDLMLIYILISITVSPNYLSYLIAIVKKLYKED